MPLIVPTGSGAQPVATPEDFGELAQRLVAPDAQDRRDAAHALAGRAEAVPDLVAALDTETDTAVRQAMLSALVTTADETAAVAMAALLRSEDAARRSEAVTALQQMPDASAGLINGLLDDPDPDMRIMAVDVIRLLAVAQAPEWLRKLLGTETHPNVAGVAVDRLAEIGGPADLPVLRNVRDRFADDPYLGFAIAMVIDRIETLEREASP